MRFTVSSAELNSKLQALSKVINSKNSLAILDNFLMEVCGSQLVITASDGENTMCSSVSIEEADGDGRFCIACSTIISAMRELAEQPLVFAIDYDRLNLEIFYQNGEYNLAVLGGDEYPVSEPIGEDCNEITIPATKLAANINRSLFATADDEMRPVMNGIYFDMRADGLGVVASDGHKLVCNKLKTFTSDNAASFILPKKPATLLRGVLSKEAQNSEAMVSIRFNSRNAEIMYPQGRLSCRLIEGRYPNYEAVIPKGNPNRISVDRRSLIGALKRVLPFASESSELIKFVVSSGKLELNSEDFDFSSSARESLVCDYSGQPMSIGFKGSAFVEVLNNLDGDEVIISLADPSRAGTIVPAEQEDGEEVLMLLMPMLIND